jgi:hypothetical protein
MVSAGQRAIGASGLNKRHADVDSALSKKAVTRAKLAADLLHPKAKPIKD